MAQPNIAHEVVRILMALCSLLALLLFYFALTTSICVFSMFCFCVFLTLYTNIVRKEIARIHQQLQWHCIVDAPEKKV